MSLPVPFEATEKRGETSARPVSSDDRLFAINFQVPTIQRGFPVGAPSPKCVFLLSSTEDQDRVGSHDHQGWQIGSPVVTSNRNRCIG